MATNNNVPFGNQELTANLLPAFYRTPANKKFLQATIDQLYQPGTLTKTSGYIGRKTAKAATGKDIYVAAADQTRQNYQLEPGISVTDALGNVTFFKDYIDYINQINVFGGNTKNHARLNKQEFYSWDPHIDWDKFINFQQYYWLPYGPDTITIYGQQESVTSTYTVLLQTEGGNNEYLFTPNGITLDPVIKLYRGQTYTFNITSPGNPFSFMTSRTTGTSARYITAGINAYGVENGTITFTVPIDAPSLMFYQSETDINLGGAIEVYDITEASVLDVEADIVGKATYVLSDGTALSNGMKVAFGGIVSPSSYASGQYYVEGVGTAIKLIPASILEIVGPYTVSESIEFDSVPFDNEPFEDATGYASTPDYIAINRASADHNPWSRYNRWFHQDVINASAMYNGNVPSLDQSARAIRPIIEFEADLKLFNMGTTAIADVNLIDTFTTDVFSTIEGTRGYNVDGIALEQGQLVLFTADTDPLVKNKIFRVEFINISGYDQINLIEVATPSENQVTLIKSGVKNQGQMYWFDGSTWNKGQEKTSINQQPLFDIVDENGISFSDASVYNGTTFTGTPIFSYKVGTGINDSVLGFPVSYLNVSNIGDIVFDFNLAIDTFQYKNSAVLITNQIDSGFLVKQDFAGNIVYVNGWQKCVTETVQAGVRVYDNSGKVNNFDIDIFDDISKLSDLVVKVYVNGVLLNANNWSIIDNPQYKQLVLNTDISLTDVLTIKTFAAQPINSNGYYEIPLNLQNNPLNESIGSFTLGEVSDHLGSIVENISAFNGSFPGANNLRDLGNVTPYGTRFVQHSGPLSLGLYHITSQENNIVHAIEKVQEDYSNFKRIFIATAGTLGVDASPQQMIELIMQRINANKPNTSPYYFSDMVPYGAAIVTPLTVVDYRIKQYPLTTSFTLDTLSNKAVGVYQTSTATGSSVTTQLIYGRDYNFDTLGYVTITDAVTLTNGDTITTYEYDSTDGSFVPETPTKLGIWPAYVPQKYTDTTLITPQTVIQGHDGSITLAYGDYRDDLLIELETRIYNNIKVKYDPTIFDIADVIPAYSRTNDYSLTEFNQVLAPQFYKWASDVGVDFTKPVNYDPANSFTYNYSEDIGPDGYPVPGYWRGIYRWMLDTDRPNICPWEMLGFSIKPSWWETVYGPAPYTSDNLVMWQDLADGVVREPNVPAVKLDKYVRPYLMAHIPVDESGNLISPIISGLASGITTSNVSSNFVFGDVAPVEAAWRRSSHFPFSVLITSMLMTPAKVFGLLLDRSRIIRNKAGQLVYSDTGLRVKPTDIVLPSIYSSTSRVQTAGIINYVVDYILNYIFNNNVNSYNAYANDLNTLTAQLSYRVGAFTNQSQFNLLLESKTPLSYGSVFIPNESYKIFLNTSSTVKKLTYSGVIVTKLTTGYEVKGYSNTQPYFYYYDYLQSGSVINVGGISASYTKWASGQQYIAGQVVEYNNLYYVANTNSTGSATFNPAFFSPLTNGLPISGGVSVQLRTVWDRSNPITVPYGTQFATVQEVVDFLIGYGEYLKDQGFIFDEFNNNLGAVANWITSAKEFMFWTTQNWSAGQDTWSDWIPNQAYSYGSIVRYDGNYYSAAYNIIASDSFDPAQWVLLSGLSSVGSSVISLSPGANNITFKTSLAVVDNINNQFNNYEIFKVDGTPLSPADIESFRDGDIVTYSTRTDGIYSASFYLIQNEHVVLIDNVDIFNDVIYNPPSGYRRDRIKVSGYVTIDWYGGLDIPGFIFDAAKIQDWQPWQDYNMGDVIGYQSLYYGAKAFIPGSASFDASKWNRLPSKPSAALLPNWTNVATQFVDFYSLEVDSFDANQQAMSQHLIGYQKRQYLDNIIQDPVSEFKFYQGMIREKGTQNVLNNLFNTLGADGDASLTFYEEWALRVGQYGASNAFDNFEIILDDGLMKNNPQGYLLTNKVNVSGVSPFIVQKTPNEIYVKPSGYDSNPFPVLDSYTPLLRSAGYVNPNDVSATLQSISAITTLNPNQFSNGSYIWAAFEGASWNVYRFTDKGIRVTDITYDSNNKILTIVTESVLGISAGDYVGLSQVSLLSGFYKVATVSLNSFTINSEFTGITNPYPNASQLVVYGLTEQRTASIDTIDKIIPPHLNPGEYLWTDDRGDGKWATWEYNPVYTQSVLFNTAPQSNLVYGKTLAINRQGTISAIADSLGQIVTHDKVGLSVPWVQRQIIQEPFISQLEIGQDPNSPINVATVIAISDDGTWMATGSPLANHVSTKFVGEWNINSSYNAGDIVKVTTNVIPQYYEAILNSLGNVITVNGVMTLDPTYWAKIPYLPVSTAGTNSSYANQGVISLYQKDSNNIFTLVDTIVSPVASANELFGSSLVFGDNVLYVSAPGHNSSTGRVYKLAYKSSVIASASYNPVGSYDAIIVVSSTSGIRSGMVVEGLGFTENQTVIGVLTQITVSVSSGIVPGMTMTGTGILSGVYVVSSVGQTVIVSGPADMSPLITSATFSNGLITRTVTVSNITSLHTLELDGSPDGIPAGILNFITTSWTYDASEVYNGATAGSNFGNAMTLSSDGSTFLISASSGTQTGKVYIYRNSGSGFSLLGTPFSGIDVGFGDSLTVSDTGEYIAISDDRSSTSKLNATGNVSIYNYNGTGYTKYQDIVNHNPQSNGRFGQKIAFMNDYQTLVVYSQNEDTYLTTTFDDGKTIFDNVTTQFINRQVNSGRIDVYDRYSSNWVFSEAMTTTEQEGDGYGQGFAVGANHIMASAPYTIDQRLKSGVVYDYSKQQNSLTWTIYRTETSVPDVSKIKKAFLYDRISGDLLQHLDIIDPAQGKIAGPAEEELKYKTFYDPAVYSYSDGSVDVNVNTGSYWSKNQVGQLWWNLTTAKFVDAYTNDISFRTNSWNTLAPGASVDVYEWVSSSIQPSLWDTQADTPAGIAKGISGKSLYGNSAYCVRQRFNSTTNSFINTYYFWVKNKTTIPSFANRNISAKDVASLIENPRGQGYSYLSLTGTNSFSLTNIASYLTGDNVVLSIEYWLIDNTDQNVHSQWSLISNDSIVNIPSNIEQKWFDSLCGSDAAGRAVPDPTLPVKLKYGVENRPRQGMFINRIEALKQFVERVNSVLINTQLVENYNISKLESYDPLPTTVSGLYDTTLDTKADLIYANIGSYTAPSVEPIIVDGRITGITVLSGGKGYLIAPFIDVIGTGTGAVVRATINAAGQITGATVLNSGKGYSSSTICQIRSYSVLVMSDETANGNWGIYSYDPSNAVWSRVLTQSYDVRNYWTYVDWYATGFSQFSAPDYSVSTFVELNTIQPQIGELVKIRTANSGGWLLLEKYADITSVDWTQSYTIVGIQNGTIQFNSDLYEFSGTSVGYDANTFDGGSFDVFAAKELRIILNTIRDDLFIGDLKQQYLNLFLSSLHYVHSEQLYVDWAFKTSFVRATYNVGELSQPVNYPIDNLQNFQDYIAEVKPYRTKIREYISDYTKLDNSSAAVTDFDLQPSYENNKVVAVNARVVNGKIVSDDTVINKYPWKFWLDNAGFTITELKLVDGGSGYITEPQIIISSESGSGATARAFFTNGVINRIVLLTPGSGYLSAPTVSVNGGLAVGGKAAKVIAIIGDSVVRSNLISMKFDRVTRTYFITDLGVTESFTGTGARVQFPLTWGPDVTVGKSSVIVNGAPALRETYTLTIVSSTASGFTKYSGLLTFDTAPDNGAQITITYNKDVSLLNAADRIQYYYDPTTGQLGKDLSQLMTGVDYGGVQVNGLDFNLNAGWDELPYATEGWDVYDKSFTDYIVTVAANTHSFTLPYTPASGTAMNIYYLGQESLTYTSDGTSLRYVYNINVTNPSVSVIRTVATPAAVTTTYVTPPANTPATTIKVASTAGIVAGMGIFGTGFTNLHTVVSVVNSTTLTISTAPTNTPSGTLSFAKNGAGSNQLTLVSTAGLKVGDTITLSGSIAYNTVITSIVNSTTVSINQIVFENIAGATNIVFSRSLVEPTDLTISENGVITLTSAITAGSTINITGRLPSIRLDDPYYGIHSGDNVQTNVNAIMTTPVANGSQQTFTIPDTFTVNAGDEFIIRKSTSDGSIATSDRDYDSNISGGDLAYSSATGLLADDIVIDGDGFVTPTSSPATEEVVPGQVVDTVAIKVFDKANTGAANIKVDSYIADGSTSSFAITQQPNNQRAVIVKVDNTIKTYTTDYTIDYRNKLVVFNSTPTAGHVVSIFSLGFNGSNILDIDYFVGDGNTTEFITKAPWLSDLTSLVYQDGVVVTPTLFKTDESYGISNVVGLRFFTAPPAGSLINFIIVSGTQQTFSITKTETVATNGETTYTLQYPIGNALPNESNMIVRVDQTILQGPNNSYFTIGKNRLTYTIDPTQFLPNTVDQQNIIVLAGGVKLKQGADYTIDPSGISVKITRTVYNLYSGKPLIISVIVGEGYTYNPTTNQITFAQAYDNTHVVEVISSYVQDILDIQRSAVTVTSTASLTADTIQFYTYKALTAGIILLNRPVLSEYYIWIVKNSLLLTPGVDYKLDTDYQTITMAVAPSVNDTITLMTFGSNVLPQSGISYMQFKDMLNRVTYKRLGLSKQTTLAQDLSWNDTEIVLTDASNFSLPSAEQNKPGVIEIRGERIEYFALNGNTLSKLRRGTLGTGVYNLNTAGTLVQDIGPSETIPYADTTITKQVVSDGTGTVILDYIPNSADDIEVFVGGYKDSAIWASGVEYSVGTIVNIGSYTYKCTTAHTSSSTFNADIANWEFFIGNIRLKKSAYSVFNVNNGPYSPGGDVTFEADFTVDGITNQVQLRNPVAIGTYITVVKQTGTAWDNSTNILNDNSKIATFIKAEPGIWYSEYTR